MIGTLGIAVTKEAAKNMAIGAGITIATTGVVVLTKKSINKYHKTKVEKIIKDFEVINKTK